MPIDTDEPTDIGALRGPHSSAVPFPLNRAEPKHHVLIFGAYPAGRGDSFGPPVYLRFAFAPVVGHEWLIPSKVVDDWGNEYSAPEVYQWIEARGGVFPRADVFGVTPDGQPRQRLVKELDLAAAPLALAARTADDFPGVCLALSLRPNPAVSGAPIPDIAPSPHPLLARAMLHYAVSPDALSKNLSAIARQLNGNATD